MEVLAPGIKFEVGQIAKYPVIINNDMYDRVCEIVSINISLSKLEWNFMKYHGTLNAIH